eukprot:TRINITY_DN18613_c0_g1_i1.p1 TRINITY_DN18613_c0_g1~~TRINITY_DN18613_c0_g1_i1.p1  ORF type:complete len:675 (+),score=183.72 TRINITY_DN18613_c0_g1_i1:243-2267(+)
MSLDSGEESRLELGLADVETRLRECVADLVRPVSTRTDRLAEQVDFLGEQLHEALRTLNTLSCLRSLPTENRLLIENIRETLGNVEASVSHNARETAELVLKTEVKLESLRRDGELKETAILALQRSCERCCSEANRLQDCYEKLSEEVLDERLREHRRHVTEQLAEHEANVAGMQLELSRYVDRVWQLETSAAQLSGEGKFHREAVSEVKGKLSELQAALTSAEMPNDLEERVRLDVRKMEEEVKSLRGQVGGVVAGVQEHLRTGLKAAADHAAASIAEVSSTTDKRIREVLKSMNELKQVRDTTGDELKVLDNRIREASASVEQALQEPLDLIHQIEIERKRERGRLDGDIQGLRAKLGDLGTAVDGVAKGIEDGAEVRQMLLEALNILCALQVQMDADLESMTLVGVKDEKYESMAHSLQSDSKGLLHCSSSSTFYQRGVGEVSPDSVGGQMLSHIPAAAAFNESGGYASPPQQSRRVVERGNSGARSARRGSVQLLHRQSVLQPKKAVLSLDRRCLSCSPSAVNVLQAFKIACLKYEAAPVRYGGECHERVDLCQAMQNLVLLARSRNAAARAEGLAASAEQAATVSLGKTADMSASLPSLSGKLERMGSSGPLAQYAMPAAKGALHQQFSPPPPPPQPSPKRPAVPDKRYTAAALMHSSAGLQKVHSVM